MGLQRSKHALFHVCPFRGDGGIWCLDAIQGCGESSAAVSDAALDMVKAAQRCMMLPCVAFAPRHLFSTYGRRLPERMVRCAEATMNVQTHRTAPAEEADWAGNHEHMCVL